MNKYSVVHFVGIGGIGMSSLAQHLLRQGVAVSGSDRQENEQTQKLRKLGATVNVPHNKNNVKNANLVVRTSAVPLSNEEVAFAMQQNIPVVLREQLLGEIFDSFPVRIAVCGTHGKTTVTAMLHHVLERCLVQHAAFIGGEFNGENYFFGNNVVVAEACEYRSSFLCLHPTLCLCLNVEYDHPDCYKNLQEVQHAFRQLFKQSKKVVLSSNDKYLCPTAAVFDENIQAKNIVYGNGVQFDLFAENSFVCRTRLRVPCEHNIRNALAVVAVAKSLGLPLLQVAQALSTFCGVDRRWTKQNCALNVVCDYAHHPTEIQTTVKTALSVCRGKIVCVFQPHTYSRTKAFFAQFVSCFDGVDEVVYLPVYAAREKPQKGATSFALYRLARSQGKNAKYFADFQRAANYLKRTVGPDDLVVLVGAGDINSMAKLL